MNQRPTIIPTARTDEKFGGVTYHIEGELVPMLTIELDQMPIYFEHHILLWKHPSVQIGIKPMKGMLKRMIAGIQIFVTEATGQGSIAFSRDGAGHIVPIHMVPGSALHVREHQFLAATSSIDYTYERVKGISNMLFGGTGFFIDEFSAQSEGILWLHGYGNVFEKVLEPGEVIEVEPGGWLYKDPNVRMESTVQRLSTGLMAGMNIVFNRFTGPGRIGLQSMYMHYGTGADDAHQSNAGGNVVGGLMELGGKLFGG
jgi:uncharacterized protein (AIM24 family)